MEIKSHKDLENHLDRYSGLILYMKEMDEVTYGKLCAVRVSWYSASATYPYPQNFQAYFSATSQLHNTQMTSLLSIYSGFIKRVPEDDPDNSP